ncbi:MAG TPA: aldo/keto reductase [Gemmatimonadales bacterium]|nr:aldo/keto reductase [Gemmatimonadales bacterium]
MRPGARTVVGPPSFFIGGKPRLGFGAWAVGGRAWGPESPEQDRLAAIERALERGTTFFDTAPSYGDGASETLLGRVLGTRREHVTIATKVGPRDDPRLALEGSLRRLATDYVDLVQLHETLDQWEWRLDQLLALQAEGKARAVGLCNARQRQLARALEIAPLAAYQGPYNLFDRDVEQRELPLARERGLAFLAYRPLASGLLTGKYAAPPTFPEGDHRRGIYWFKGREFARRQMVVDRLRPIAQRIGVPLAGLALSWILAQPGVSIVLVGARNSEQVDQTFGGARPLTADIVTEIDAVVAEVFRPGRATTQAQALAARWGERERHIVERLNGTTTYEAIAADWTDRGEPPMVAAQVKVFCDQLRDRGLVVTDDG